MIIGNVRIGNDWGNIAINPAVIWNLRCWEHEGLDAGDFLLVATPHDANSETRRQCNQSPTVNNTPARRRKRTADHKGSDKSTLPSHTQRASRRLVSSRSDKLDKDKGSHSYRVVNTVTGRTIGYHDAPTCFAIAMRANAKAGSEVYCAADA